MSDPDYAVAEGGDDDDSTVVVLTAMLVELSPAQMEAFKKEGLDMVKANESLGGMSASRLTEEGPLANFYFSYPYALTDRTTIEDWLRRHPLVRRIRFEEDVSNKQR
ncbi:MAG: hypothetical protein ACJ796_10385 [Gemmatimonadaceae bacterium]